MSDTTTLQSLESLELATRTPLPPSTSTLHVSSPLSETDNDGVEALELANTSTTGINESTLPPKDRGFGAWSFLAGAFVVEALIWGFPNAYGVFLDAYLADPAFADQPNAHTLLPLAGTLSSGIIYCSGVVVNPVAARYPHRRRASMWAATGLCWAGLFGASYARTVVELVLLQGALFAIGGSLLYSHCLSFMSEWFVERRGLANGVLFAGTAAGGLVLPLVLPPLFARLGIRTTLRALSLVLLGALAAVLPFVRGRLPHSSAMQIAARGRGARWEWARSRTFGMVLLVNTVQGFAYFVPIVWLPTFARDLLVGETSSALAVALLNGASVVGRLSMGFLSDKYNPWLLGLATLLATSAATFVLWGVLAHTLGGLLAFGTAYGLVATGWTSLYTGFVRGIAKDDPVHATALFGYLLFSRGIGNILSTPIAASLARAGTGGAGGRLGFDVGGGRFERMIVYVGTCFAGAAVVAGVGWGAEVWRPRRFRERSQ